MRNFCYVLIPLMLILSILLGMSACTTDPSDTPGQSTESAEESTAPETGSQDRARRAERRDCQSGTRAVAL